MKAIVSLGTFLAAAILHGAAIEQVIVRQQWPWSTDVKVEYKLSGVDADHPVNLSVRALNGQTELDNSKLVSAITGELWGITESGIGQLVIDPVKAFGTATVALANFKVKLTVTDAPTNINEVLYKIYCLTNGVCTDVRRADFYAGKYGDYVESFAAIDPSFSTHLDDVLIWTGITNNIDYKTTHLVMRKIPAGSFTYGEGADSQVYYGNEIARTNATITKDYYIGVFELSVAQKKYIYDGMAAVVDVNADAGPIGAIPYAHYTAASAIRSRPGLDQSGSQGSNWPQWTGVYNGSFMSKLRSCTKGVAFDLPTEAQWEKAARGGTSGIYYVSDDNTPDSTVLAKLAWCRASSPEAHKPGLKKPNAYGLYDVLGNYTEYVLDWYVQKYDPETAEGDLNDPAGPNEGYSDGIRPYRALKGFDYLNYTSTSGQNNVHIGGRLSLGHDQQSNRYGFRVCCPAE